VKGEKRNNAECAPAFISNLLAAPGHDYNLSAPGEISTGGGGEFSIGANWEFSTGTDNALRVSGAILAGHLLRAWSSFQFPKPQRVSWNPRRMIGWKIL
jgi:hypothetical protein